ncbi:YgjP-like metallopeptidase domain-containing protein [uncultured Prevotella sp.]|uniref:YgjP-like metallopeptidase domain-containing protein n=1 Tax=uncultured Prevotella sp. TaxID=159272 RepID=UPI00266D3E25|nr:YgjP-like metallopeptidase domain-containing protein [uncultured Prevotella sp.]
MEHQVKHAPPFWINPNFRLNTPNFRFSWYMADINTLRQEATVFLEERKVYQASSQCVVCMLSPNHDTLYIVYAENTNFGNLRLQKWLRETIRDEITARAKLVLPPRLRELEKKHNLYGNRVFVKKLRGNTMGCCSVYNDITLMPGLIIMPQPLIDSVILHEMAHYKHKHHRKSFWKFLSQLLGEDAKMQKGAMDIALSKYWLQIKYLMK